MDQTRSRTEFLENVRRALGRTSPPADIEVPDATAFSDDRDAVGKRTESIRRDMDTRVADLVEELVVSAEAAEWIVHRAGPSDAALYVRKVAETLESTSVLRSGHALLDEIGLEEAFEGSAIALQRIAHDDSGPRRDVQRAKFREDMIVADIGVTGVDHAIAETGSVSIAAGRGVSRLISLLPPVHIAVVSPAQIVPSLDELFSFRRSEFLQRGSLDYTNIISGPSRSGDIEQTLIKGMHGPREVHMVIVD
ncbi:MAG: lactate utilization protein [Chloroflexi bacterium]|nr:lactate utilization protein [Chloroflexota bacterium]